MPAVTVTAARNANRCGGAGSGLGCCVVVQAGLGTGTTILVATGTDVAQVAAVQDVETQGSAVACARQRVDVQGSAPTGALKRLGRGGDEVNEKPTPSPHFRSLRRQPKGSFRYIANLCRNLLHLKIDFSILKIKIILKLKINIII